jgi:ribosomal protein L12E/L44/L45/RPP1/RPP2
LIAGSVENERERALASHLEQDVVGEAVEERRDISAAAAVAPDAMRADAGDREEADLTRRVRASDIVERDARRSVARLRFAERVADRAAAISAFV